MTRRNLWLKLTAIFFAALLLAGLIGTQVETRMALGQETAERNARHTATCSAIPFLTFDSTSVLHTYELRIDCPIVGTVPRGGGRPVIPVVTPKPSPAATVTAPGPTVTRTSVRLVPGPTPTPAPTVTTTQRMTTRVTVTARVTATRTCLLVICS